MFPSQSQGFAMFWDWNQPLRPNSAAKPPRLWHLRSVAQCGGVESIFCHRQPQLQRHQWQPMGATAAPQTGHWRASLKSNDHGKPRLAGELTWWPSVTKCCTMLRSSSTSSAAWQYIIIYFKKMRTTMHFGEMFTFTCTVVTEFVFAGAWGSASVFLRKSNWLKFWWNKGS